MIKASCGKSVWEDTVALPTLLPGPEYHYHSDQLTTAITFLRSHKAMCVPEIVLIALLNGNLKLLNEGYSFRLIG